MSGGSQPNYLRYGEVFEDWELAVARSVVRRFCSDKKRFLGFEFDDLLQEGLSHWLKNRDTYDPNGGASRETYMDVVVSRKLLDLLASEMAQKRQMLQKAESLDQPMNEEGQTPLDHIEADPNRPPDTDLNIDLERVSKLLTARQREILILKTHEVPHVTIAERLGVSRDTVQTEIRRVRALFEKAGLRDYL